MLICSKCASKHCDTFINKFEEFFTLPCYCQWGPQNRLTNSSISLITINCDSFLRTSLIITLNHCYKFLYSYIVRNIRQVSSHIPNTSGIHYNGRVLISCKSLMKISHLEILEKIPVFKVEVKYQWISSLLSHEICHLSIFTGSTV